MSLWPANLESNLIVKLIWDSRLAAKTIFHFQRENFIIERARLLVGNLHNKKRRVNAKKIELAKLNGESSRPQMMSEEIIWESGKIFSAKGKRFEKKFLVRCLHKVGPERGRLSVRMMNGK